MDERLKGRSVAVLATDGVEESEYVQPRQAVERAGATVELVSPHAGQIQAFRHDDKAGRYPVDKTTDQVSAQMYDALLLPGGVANPDRLRTDAAAVAFVRAMAIAHKPIGVICHGPWTLVEADVLRGRTITSWPSLRTDIVNAGGGWVDEPCHVEYGWVSSRKPGDLPAFCAAVVEQFATEAVTVDG